MARNGRIVVAVVLTIALSLGALGSWWLVQARPRPGDYVDLLALPDGGAVVIRRERGTDHAFVEVRSRDRLRWRGLVPRYAGAPGAIAVAASPSVVTVRVARGGHPHLFAFDTATGAKIASFDLAEDAPSDPHAYTLPGLATVSEGERALEVLGRPGGGARLILVELRERRLAWKVDLPAPPDAAWLDGDQVVVRRGAAISAWAIGDGAPVAPRREQPPTRDAALGYPVPATAVPPRAYHRGGDRIWIVEPTQLTVLDASFAPIATIKD